MRIVYTIVLSIFFFSTEAQNLLDRSLKKYQDGELRAAKILIDSALTSDLYASENVSWYLKGFIYKDLYKSNTSSSESDELRKTSVNSFYRLLNMDSVGQYKKETLQNLKYLATTYYNDAMKLIQNQNFSGANIYYSRFIAVYSPINDGSISLSNSELQFHLALGSGYIQKQQLDSTKNYSRLALAAFEHVLSLDSMNKEANYQIGVIYYNDAVNRILDLDYDDLDLLAFGKFEDETIELFKKSLPYMEQAYRVNDKDENILEGLAGIHFGLREFEISNKYREELTALKEDD